jgi:hypothetical protein
VASNAMDIGKAYTAAYAEAYEVGEKCMEHFME